MKARGKKKKKMLKKNHLYLFFEESHCGQALSLDLWNIFRLIIFSYQQGWWRQ